MPLALFAAGEAPEASLSLDTDGDGQPDIGMPLQVSGQGYGLFTYYLLEAPSGRADRNADGWVDAAEACEYVAHGSKKRPGAFQVGMNRIRPFAAKARP